MTVTTRRASESHDDGQGEHQAYPPGQEPGPWDNLGRDDQAQLLRDLDTAAAEAAAGDLVDHDEVAAELRAYLDGRASPKSVRLFTQI